MKMTEHVRKISQFFMKKFPLDIDSIYYPRPDPNQEYFTYKSAAIVGGTFNSVSEIIEKILLINQLVRQFEHLIIVGELGLLGLHTIGIYPGQIERSENSIKEYDSLKEFMKKVFEKGVELGCNIQIPVDAYVAESRGLEDIMNEKADGQEGTAQEGSAPEKSNPTKTGTAE